MIQSAAAKFKMAALQEVHQKQRAVIEFLVAEGETPLNIHKRLQNVYGDCAIDYSTVKRWVRWVKESEEVGKASVVDFPRSGRPATPARLVPKQLTGGQKTARVDSCTELLQECQSDPTFLQRIITGDETWVHHYESESKRRSMEWRHPSSPRTKECKAERSAGKVMATVFWDSKSSLWTHEGSTERRLVLH